MPYLNYKYTANSGTVYQVGLPSDIAATFSYVLAAGTEPYLDAIISPRYATYVSTTGLQRAAVITTQTLFAAPPSSFSLGGVTYRLQSAIGEKTPPYLSPLNLFPQGPQGPAGPSGLANYTSVAAISDTLLVSTVWTTLASVFVTVSGTTIALSQSVFTPGASAGTVSLRLFDSTNNVVYGSLGSNLLTTTGAYWTICGSRFESIPAGNKTLALQALSNVAGITNKFENQQGTPEATSLTLLFIP